MSPKHSKLVINLTFITGACFVLLLDQVTKYVVNKLISASGSVEIIPNIFFLTNIKNSGAAFGLFQNGTNILIVISIVAVLLIIFLKIKLNLDSIAYNISLGFVLGGALGNLVDRYLIGEVTDFFNFVYWPVFNIADSFIVIGFGVIILIIVKEYLRKDHAKRG